MSNLENDSSFMDKYSRQIGAFGIETMAKLVKLRVLLIGMKGVGIECAKNLILAGPGCVTIYDDEFTKVSDLGSNFFLTENDIGKPRASSVAMKLAELNKMVSVKVHEGSLTEKVVQEHDVVVFTNTKRDEMIKWNNFCRSQQPSIGFIVCDVRGAMGYAFTDFGDRFMLHDSNGENPITRIITDITNDKEGGVISLLGPDEDGKMHELPDSDHDGWIEISDVRGMVSKTNPDENINTCPPWRIKFMNKKVQRTGKNGEKITAEVFDPFHLRIGDTSSFTKYEGGGIITQHKKPYPVEFFSFEHALKNPIYPGSYGLMFTDGAKFGRGEQLHVAIMALLEFEQSHGHLPEPYNCDHIEEVLDNAKKRFIAEDEQENPTFTVEEIDEDVIRKVSMYAAIELQPLATFFGGLVAQEIVKFTGKFTPLKQWLHLDVFEVLPENPPSDTQPLNSRYDHIIQMFGQSFHQRLGNMKTFLVGCGALGCEYLKNFAMIGFACGEKGLITVTDNDRIEVSNLNRQFLFRENNVGQPKSVAATNSVRSMNSNLRVEALEHLVAPHTEHIFNDPFWNQLDIVTNALDNVKARLYVDSKCVFYKIPLLESGTLGTKCNVQVIIPHITQSYADGPKDAEGDNIPMCTLRNFPSLIEHCIEWARAQFEDVFTAPFGDAKKFVSDPKSYLSEIRQQTVDNPNKQIGNSKMGQELNRLQKLYSTLKSASNITFEKCIEMAIDLFHSCFRDRILQLIHNFPENHITSSGEQFWSGAKRFPQSASIDMNNSTHASFIIASANIFAVCFGIYPPPEVKLLPSDSETRNISFISKITSTIKIPQWKPSSEKIAENDDALKKMEEENKKNLSTDVDTFNKLINELSNYECSGLSFEPADFEKDQDLNFHIDFITASSNLRAWNYQIREVSRHKCKMIAGKIIPAIATTTSSVTGLAMIEMLKIIQKKELSAYKDSSNSLGLNMYLMQEPAPPEKAKDEYDVIEMSEVKCIPSGFTKWDNTYINDGDLTLEEFLTSFKKMTKLNCDLLFHGVAEQGDENEKFKCVSGLMLYDRHAFNKDLKLVYESNYKVKLVDWIHNRYNGLIDVKMSNYVELQTSCSDDDGNSYRVPTVIYKFK